MDKPFTEDFDAMVKRRAIRVAVTYNRTHYFVDGAAQHGLAFDAATAFVDELNRAQHAKVLRTEAVFHPVRGP